MLHNLKNAAENYLNGTTTADEMLASFMAACHQRWEHLSVDTNLANDAALDVDALARAIHNMNVTSGTL